MSLSLTPSGNDLLLRALAGTADINFTHIQIGSGTDAGSSATALTTPKMTFSIENITTGDVFASLRCTYNNYDVSVGFRSTELGVFATDPDDSSAEILYAYEYTPPADADYVPANTDRTLETELTVLVYVGEAANVTAEIASGAYASRADLLAHTGNTNNPHNVTLAQVGGAAANHTHDASAIVSGVLPVTKGGTGNNTGYVTEGQRSGTDLGYRATAEGRSTTASEQAAHAEGYSANASGFCAHAEGYDTMASEYAAHAEGYETAAEEYAAHAEGRNTLAGGYASHAEGNGYTEVELSIWGDADATTYTYAPGQDPLTADIIENITRYRLGVTTDVGFRSAAITAIDTSRRTITVSETLWSDGSISETGRLFLPTMASGGAAHAEGIASVAEGRASHAEGNRTIARGKYSHAEGSYENPAELCGVSAAAAGTTTYTMYSNLDLGLTTTRVRKGMIVWLYGDRTNQSKITAATGSTFTVESSLNPDNAISDTTLCSDNSADGEGSHSEGVDTKAFGRGSHAEGWGCFATMGGSHAEGGSTTAHGQGSHAEGTLTLAGANNAHAEGYLTVASGGNSHSEGYYTKATHHAQHAFGEFNVQDPSSASNYQRGTYIEIVGNGTDDENLSNARTLDWNGDEWIAGILTQASDARLKDVDGEVPDVSGIRAVRFRWNDQKGSHDDKDHIGYLAQDVEAIAPFLVGEDAEGYKSLNYIALLCAKVEWLERRVAELEG